MGAIIAPFCKVCADDTESQGTQMSQFKPRGPMSVGILPATKARVRSDALKFFINKVYSVMNQWEPPYAHTVLAHASKDPDQNTLNFALPDLSAEYWITPISYVEAPILELNFPDWDLYSCLTLYNIEGVPIASMNSLQARQAYIDPNDQRVIAVIDGSGEKRLQINLCRNMIVTKYEDDVLLVYRVYRPPDVAIIPHEMLPKIRVIDKDFVNEEILPESDWLPTAPEDISFDHARSLDDMLFNRGLGSIVSQSAKFSKRGTQFFYPRSAEGLFINANATYLCALLPKNKKVMKMSCKVPHKTRYRPYYGFVAGDLSNTSTKNSITQMGLGGWTAVYTIWAGKEKSQAEKHGMKKTDIFLSFEDAKIPVLVLRYLHYFRPDTGLTHEQLALANRERANLSSLDGTIDQLRKTNVRSVPKVEYF